MPHLFSTGLAEAEEELVSSTVFFTASGSAGDDRAFVLFAGFFGLRTPDLVLLRNVAMAFLRSMSGTSESGETSMS